MAFNPNAMSNAEYYAAQQAYAPAAYADPYGVPTIDLLNLAQVVGYPQGHFDPNALSDEAYYAMQQRYLNPSGGMQYYNAPVRRATPRRLPVTPAPSTPAPFDPNDFIGTPYGPQMIGPIMIQPPQDWAPQAMSPYVPYYG